MKTRLTIDIQHHPRIRVIVKPLETLYHYQYKDFWIKNAEKNAVYLPNSSWKLMMIWCEKIAFVKECIDRQYFDTPYYGWCDIGYFRNRVGVDTPVVDLTHWSHPHAIHSFMGKSDPLGSRKKIIYANVCPYGEEYMQALIEQILTSDDIPTIPPTQISIAGGFFLLDPSNIGWWFDTFDQRLRQYIQHDCLVKDDQILLADCIYNHPDRFYLCEEKQAGYDNWFMFQRILNYVPFTARIGISILMPLYNGVEFIPESVASVLAQTYQRWELIIGVNGHPTGSHVYRTAQTFACAKIKVVELAASITGKSAALNEMVKYCQYEYVALLDVDDIWHERKLEVQLPKIADQYDVVGSHCVYFGDRQGEPALPVQDLSQFDFTQCNPIINSSCVLKKEWAHWTPLWDGVEDYDLWLRLRKQGKTFYNCPERLVKHRIHANSAFNARGNHAKVAKLLKSFQV
jgi:amylovoran biosynthesis glycosyltransferase AmsE